MAYFKMNDTNYTQKLAQYTADLTYDKIPPEVIERAKLMTLHTLGVTLAAKKDELAIDSVSSFVTAINGVSGKYLYCGDFSAEQGLALLAGSVHYLFFTEDREASLAAGRMALMQSMADYLEEAADVKNAAADAYQAALDLGKL